MKTLLRDSWPLALLASTVAFMLWQFPVKAIVFSPAKNERAPVRHFASFVKLSPERQSKLYRKAGITWKAKSGARVSSAMASDAGPALSDPLPEKQYLPLPESFGLYAEIVHPEFPKIENRLLPRTLAAPKPAPLKKMEKAPDSFRQEIKDSLKPIPAFMNIDFNKRKGENNDDRTRGIERFYGN